MTYYIQVAKVKSKRQKARKQEFELFKGKASHNDNPLTILNIYSIFNNPLPFKQFMLK